MPHWCRTVFRHSLMAAALLFAASCSKHDAPETQSTKPPLSKAPAENSPAASPPYVRDTAAGAVDAARDAAAGAVDAADAAAGAAGAATDAASREPPGAPSDPGPTAGTPGRTQ